MGMGHAACGIGQGAFFLHFPSQASRFSFPRFSFLVPRLYLGMPFCRLCRLSRVF